MQHKARHRHVKNAVSEGQGPAITCYDRLPVGN